MNLETCTDTPSITPSNSQSETENQTIARPDSLENIQSNRLQSTNESLVAIFQLEPNDKSKPTADSLRMGIPLHILLPSLIPPLPHKPPISSLLSRLEDFMELAPIDQIKLKQIQNSLKRIDGLEKRLNNIEQSFLSVHQRIEKVRNKFETKNKE